MITVPELRRAVDRLPRVSLAQLPTPLELLPRFSAALGGPPVWIKRDDCTGLAFGGNKARHNEFLLGHALEQKAEMLVWGAGVQSNNCRQTAAACARLGLACHLMLGSGGQAVEVQGNLLLDYLLGATVEILDLPLGPELYERIAAKAVELRAQGKRVYSWENEVVKPRAAASYALCFAEIVEQCQREQLSPRTIYVASAGSTAAGLLLGKAALGSSIAIRIVAPIRWPWDHASDLAKTANRAAELLDLSVRVAPEDVHTSLDFIGPGYGIISPQGQEALDLMARTEGILLDPVYTAKALAALIEDVRRRRLQQEAVDNSAPRVVAAGNQGRRRPVPPDHPLIFLHTGGTPALFAYHDELAPR